MPKNLRIPHRFLEKEKGINVVASLRQEGRNPFDDFHLTNLFPRQTGLLAGSQHLVNSTGSQKTFHTQRPDAEEIVKPGSAQDD